MHEFVTTIDIGFFGRVCILNVYKYEENDTPKRSHTNLERNSLFSCLSLFMKSVEEEI